MNFLCPCVPKQLYDTSHGIAANDRIVHQNHTFVFYAFLYCGELYFNTVKSCTLSRRNKGSADIFVLDKADTVRDTRFLAKAKRCIQPRLGGADDNLGGNGMCLCKNFPCFNSGSVYRNAVYNGIRTSKIDVLKHTELFIFFATVLTA